MSVESERQRSILALLAGVKGLTIVEIAREMRFSLRKTAQGAQMLILRGLAERSPEGAYSATEAGLKVHASGGAFRSGPVRPRGQMKVPTDTLRQRAWTGMRLHGRFTIDDLVTVAARSDDRQPHAALQRYLSSLCSAEFVARLPRRKPGQALTSNGAVVYRLVRDTGERAPTISRKGEVVDRNGAPT